VAGRSSSGDGSRHDLWQPVVFAQERRTTRYTRLPEVAVPGDSLSQPYAPFHIDVHPERDVVRVVPVGELDLATAPELEAQLHELGRSGFERLVLDLRQLRFVDSTGIRVILSADQDAGAAGHEFSLIGGPPAVQRALEVCGLLERLRVEPG